VTTGPGRYVLPGPVLSGALLADEWAP